MFDGKMNLVGTFGSSKLKILKSFQIKIKEKQEYLREIGF